MIPDPTIVGDSNKFPGEAVAMGGNILPLEEQFDSRKSLRFHKGKKETFISILPANFYSNGSNMKPKCLIRIKLYLDSLVILTSSADSSNWKKYMEWIVGYTKVMLL